MNRIRRIHDLLLWTYGPQGWWPVGGTYFPSRVDPFEITVGAVLTQNVSWSNAARALEALRERGWLEPRRMIRVGAERLAPIIRSSGYYNQKAGRLIEICRFHLDLMERDAPPTRDELLKIRGIGPETADSILLYAYGKPLFVIDAYTKRLCTRTGMAPEHAAYHDLQQLFMNNLPPDSELFSEYHALIVRHAKESCRKKPLCEHCSLRRGGLCSF
jgi:endonuclease-3 related protein